MAVQAGAAVAVADPPAPLNPTEALAAADALAEAGEYLEAIALLTESNRRNPKPKVDVRLVQLRHAAFDEVDWPEGPTEWPPAAPDLFEGVTGPPEVPVADLTADNLRSAMVNHGCLLVRGFVPPERVITIVNGIEQAFQSYDAGEELPEGESKAQPPIYVPFKPKKRYATNMLARGWVRHGGGVLTMDSPRMMSEVFEVFEDAHLREAIGGYLGERPAVAGGKCTLRRVPVDIGGADWHQDGSFLGTGIRAVNVWVALTACGGDAMAPGLDIVPRRVPELLETGAEGAWFEWSIAPSTVAEAAGDREVVRPAFAAGDALLFDDLFVHRTGVDHGMTDERYAIENWFFAPSKYPDDQLPLVF